MQQELKDILTAAVISVPPTAAISETMKIMRRHDISCVLVLAEDRPVGIITERNLVGFAARQGMEYLDCEARELMSTPVLTVPAGMDLYAAYNYLTTRKIRHLVVVDRADKAVGVVTQSDIVAHLSYDTFVEIKKVSQVMSRVVFTLPRTVSVKQALQEMSEKSVSCLVVVDKERPIGILTERDVARLLMEFRDLNRLEVGEVMSRSVQTAFSDTPLSDAVRTMQRHKLRRLVIIDRSGRIIGLATQSDIVRGLEGKYIERLNRIIKEKEDIIEHTSRDLAVKTVYLDNILQSAVDYGIIAVDPDFRVVYFNPGAERILSLPAERIVGRSIEDFHEENGVSFHQVRKAMTSLGNGKSHAFLMDRSTGPGRQYISARASAINDRDGERIGYSLMIKDITQRKLAEEQLLQAHRKLEDRVHARTRKLARTMEGTIQAMALTVEMRDPYTSGHQRRVADLAAAIARELHLPDLTVEGINMAGLIHDIGKIRVPSGILCHPGRLNETEFAIIMPHADIGYDILNGIEFPWPLAEIVRQHHEKLDGTGYPRGLKGDEILPEARILAVADAVEAMSSHRPYRPSLGIEHALDQIVRLRGVHYDPEVVDTSRKLFLDKEYRFPPALDQAN